MKSKLSILLSLIVLITYAQYAPTYYSSIDFSLYGDEMKSQLSNLITETHTNIIDYSELKDLLEMSDVDPDNPNNLLLIYGSESVGIHQRSRAIYANWEREHIYANSQGTPHLGTSGPGADAHHLRPCDASINNSRGNAYFDEGFGPRAYRTLRGGWFPGDEWKGDVARIIMYMYVRYGSQAQPLNIVYPPHTFSDDFPDILLKWNVEDPVSDFEIQRNNIVANTQNNRNPFIDNPYFATLIWGGYLAENTWPDSFYEGLSTDNIPPIKPEQLAINNITETSVNLSWETSTDNISVVGYDVYVNGNLHDRYYINEATVIGLNPETNYAFWVEAIDVVGNHSEPSDEVWGATLGYRGGVEEASCSVEDFENIPSTGSNPTASSYANRTWTSNNIIWSATNARTDQQVYIDGNENKAICIKRGKLRSTVISGGIGSFSIRTFLPFNDAEGYYVLKINGVVKGHIPYANEPTTHTINNINVTGNIIIELLDEATNHRVSFDNLTWTCYEDNIAIDEVEATKSDFKIYPNPVKNNILYFVGLEGDETVYIYSANGKLMKTLNHVNNHQKIVLRDLPKGIYFIHTKDMSKKLIIH